MARNLAKGADLLAKIKLCAQKIDLFEGSDIWENL